MTDEEKTEEYMNKIKKQYLLSEEGLGCAEQGYLDGLAEGRKSEIENNPIKIILDLKSQIVKLNEYARSICINRKGESECKYHWDCSDCVRWEMEK